ncbi:MAG TPA: histidine triad nucleotide-binding protein [Candidatus Limnocylindria bacterium]|nr:histidine triad nucleotide-binding protein [Candidatus Limnocylindria bacterium]
MANDCLFCSIAAGEVPADIVQQDDLVVAFRDITPKAPTHVLLIPRRHIASAADLSGTDSEMLGRLFAVAAQVARDAGVAEDGFRLVTNSGPAAGQSVAHLHFHLLGGRSLGWPPG